MNCRHVTVNTHIPVGNSNVRRKEARRAACGLGVVDGDEALEVGVGEGEEELRVTRARTINHTSRAPDSPHPTAWPQAG